MNVISLSGPCGSGKSTLIGMLCTEFEFINLVYKNTKGAALAPSSYNSKVDYIDNWFRELLLQKEKGKTLLLSDRSPFDSLAYLEENVGEFEIEIFSKFKVLPEKEIFHYSILITANKKELVQRIKYRFNNGHRNETVYEQELLLLDKSLLFFTNNISFYDYVLDNTSKSPNKSLEEIKRYIADINNR